MGIGTLRRYHPTIDPELKADAKADPDPLVRAHQEAIEAATQAFDAARDAANEATEKANAVPDSPSLAQAAEEAATAAQAAQDELERIQKEWNDKQSQVAQFPDAPKRTANKADWIAYAGDHGRPVEGLKHPDTVDGAGADVPGKAFTRDEIADLFLGPKTPTTDAAAKAADDASKSQGTE